ncbi:hypothetical protein OROGR_005686 [Orobanche gracilis]
MGFTKIHHHSCCTVPFGLYIVDTEVESDPSQLDDEDVASFEIDGYNSNVEMMNTPVSTDDEEDYRVEFPSFNEGVDFGEVYLEVGMEFPTLDLFKNAVKDYNISLGRQFKWIKNDKKRARSVCKEVGCPWVASCSWNSKDNAFQIKTFNEEHTCCRVFQNKGASRGWVAKKLEKRLLTQPDLKQKQAYEIMKEDFQVHLNDKKVGRALKQAREAVEGSETEQYGKLRDYLHELLITNPGSTALMNVIPRPNCPPLFHRLYICLDACRKGFKAGCRAMIGLDGCFLKGYYGGQLLSAVGQDANNQFYVIAYAVVDAETTDNWRWFLELLEQDLGDHRQHGWNFISDQQKGLEAALKEVMPYAHHRNCVVHIWKNFIKKWKTKELRGVVWACAQLTTESQYNNFMKDLRKKNEDAWKYLNCRKETWVKAFFSHGPKVDNITNNQCEVWNSKIVRYREKPILTMLEEVRSYVMRRMAAHKRMLATFRNKLPPVQQRKLDRLKVDSNGWTPTFTGDADDESFEVTKHKSRLAVSLSRHTCTCNVWQLTGIPCAHAIAAIAWKNERPEDYVHPWLTVDSMHATYEYFIKPVNSEEFWTETNNPKPEPPKLKRPKKQRRKDGHSEERPGTSKNKVKRTWDVLCYRCGEHGHIEKTCVGEALPEPAKIRHPKKTQAKIAEGTTSPSPSTQPINKLQPIRPPTNVSTHGTQSITHHSNAIQFTASTPGTQFIRPPTPELFMFIPTPGLRPPPPPSGSNSNKL